MQIRKLFVALACAALTLPAAAHGKGATQATIEGDGLKGGAITFKSDSGEGDPPPGSKLARLAEETGFFPAVFGQSPSPIERGRPEGDLGPRYTVTYTMPGPNNELDELRQELYPYAEGGTVTYMPPGQPFFGSEKTRGGWFRADPDLKSLLVEAGLPASPPTGPTETRYDVSWSAAGIVVVLVGLLGAALIVVARWRPGPLTAR